VRKESRNMQQANLANIQGYHQGGTWSDRESYVSQGFNGLYYLNSDRKIKLDDDYRRADGQPLQGFGLEIETECHGTRNTAVLAEVFQNIIFPKFKFGDVQFKMQEDGSLGGDSSVEVISQVMTKSRIRNDYAAYKLMFDTYFQSFGITADARHTSCGMHVNVSNACFGKTEAQQRENVMKLHYMLNKHFSVLSSALYRPLDKTYWCDRMDKDTMEGYQIDSRTAEKYDYRNARNVTDLSDAPKSHHCCLNMSHFRAGRVEIRLVGGQRDYYCFRNTMETVFFLCDRVRSLKWEELDDIKTIFRGCNQYVMKRLPDCGLDAETLEAIRATVKTEDLELAR